VPLRVLTWNCQGAFRRKFPLIRRYAPDILVVSECESPAFLEGKGAALPWPNFGWVGENPAKGLGVFARKGIRLNLAEWHDPTHRFFAPFIVENAAQTFPLFAVWTQAEKQIAKGYATHSINALKTYRDHLGPDAILAGDFNSSPVFAQSDKRHVEMTATLEDHGLTSAYHELRGEDHGGERRATFFLHRNRAKPYHLDYIYTAKGRAKVVRLGQPGLWLQHSDHLPLVVDV